MKKALLGQLARVAFRFARVGCAGISVRLASSLQDGSRSVGPRRMIHAMRTHPSRLAALLVTITAATTLAQTAPPAMLPSDVTTPPTDAAPPPTVTGEATTAAIEPSATATAAAEVTPPEPPPVTGPLPQPFAPPPAMFMAQRQLDEGRMRAGVYGGLPYFIDEHDRLRLYPGGRLRTDFQVSPASPDLPGTGAGLGPRFFVRRVRLDLSGELYGRLAFSLGAELGNERIGDAGSSSTGTPRLTTVSAHAAALRPVDVSVSYRLRRWLSFTIGQQNTPFSMSNRTAEPALSGMERPLAIRGFAVPDESALGLGIWGDVTEFASYELGVFDGDGGHGPFADRTPDFIGRATVRPLRRLGKSKLVRELELGMSGRIGGRDMVHYGYPTLATAAGFVMWQPGYVDSLGRSTQILPSGKQRAVGGEVRVPVELPGGRGLDARAEAYFVDNGTREGVDGFIATHSERFGRVQGIGWSAQVSLWALGDAFVSGTPGVWRPKHVQLDDDEPLRRGLEVAVFASGVNASYSGATREGSVEDALTPRSNITVYELGAGLTYWRGTLFRAGAQYLAYVAPASGTDANFIALPGDLPDSGGKVAGGDVHHELAARVGVSF
ncbi:MAG: hypothetical protein EXR75_00070 [Myxococcales bacterium]|nr:hypothetical protein [Myxococcales bacterium]